MSYIDNTAFIQSLHPATPAGPSSDQVLFVVIGAMIIIGIGVYYWEYSRRLEKQVEYLKDPWAAR